MYICKDSWQLFKSAMTPQARRRTVVEGLGGEVKTVAFSEGKPG
jgi:hypothetical protein